jgi:hypothetical protein
MNDRDEELRAQIASLFDDIQQDAVKGEKAADGDGTPEDMRRFLQSILEEVCELQRLLQ